jgi:hypothetical protein
MKVLHMLSSISVLLAGLPSTTLVVVLSRIGIYFGPHAAIIPPVIQILYFLKSNP